MVQRTLAARSISHAQGGTLFAGYLKLLPIFLLVIPGMISRVLFTGKLCSIFRLLSSLVYMEQLRWWTDPLNCWWVRVFTNLENWWGRGKLVNFVDGQEKWCVIRVVLLFVMIELYHHQFVTMVTKTWFKTEFKTKVNLSFGLKTDLAFRLALV